MCQKTYVLFFFVQFGIVGKTILYRPSQGDVRINNAVGLRYNFAINATGNMLVGCTVIFYSLFHNQNMFFREPLP